MTSRIGNLLATVAHLAVVGIAGTVMFSIWITMISVGIGMVFVFGLGLVMLAACAWWCWPTAQFEEARIAGLYGLWIPPRRMPRSTRTDWLRGAHTMYLQVTDRRNLTGVANLGIATLLGLVSLGLWQLTIAGFAMLVYRGEGWLWGYEFLGSVSGALAIPIGIGVVLLALCGNYALALAHRSISVSLMTPSRETELVEQVRATSQQRSEAVHAAEVERSRIERDLHDGVQPRLVSVGMTLGMAQAKLESDPAAAAALIDEAHASTKAAITELRQLARGIHPAVLTDRGLDAALSAVAARSPVPVNLDVQLAARPRPEIEAALYFAVAESLTNVAKHSGASLAHVVIRTRPGGTVWARIEDDGVGGAHVQPGGGLDGVANRIRSAGGTFTLSSPPNGPTTIEVSLPCAS